MKVIDLYPLKVMKLLGSKAGKTMLTGRETRHGLGLGVDFLMGKLR